MKKFVVSLIACFALAQSSFAATSALTESLLEYEAITNAIGTDPNFQNIIPVTQFIVDIKRLTPQIDITGTVEYKIVTKTVTANSSPTCDVDCEVLEIEASKKHNRNRSNTTAYLATLNVAPNPGIGPNIVTVVSITLLPQTKPKHNRS